MKKSVNLLVACNEQELRKGVYWLSNGHWAARFELFGGEKKVLAVATSTPWDEKPMLARVKKGKKFERSDLTWHMEDGTARAFVDAFGELAWVDDCYVEAFGLKELWGTDDDTDPMTDGAKLTFIVMRIKPPEDKHAKLIFRDVVMPAENALAYSQLKEPIGKCWVCYCAACCALRRHAGVESAVAASVPRPCAQAKCKAEAQDGSGFCRKHQPESTKEAVKHRSKKPTKRVSPERPEAKDTGGDWTDAL